jgi:phage/plasmid-associated DNA primase
MILLTDTIFIKKENYDTQLKRVNIEELTWDTLKNGVYTHEFLNEVGTDGCGGDICRLFFDIDAKYDKSSKTNLFEKHVQIIGVLTKNASRYNFVFTDGSYENEDKYTKLSFHIIFQDKYIHKPSFTSDMYDLSHIFIGLDQVIIDELINNVDNSVYKKHALFRLPYGTQKGKIAVHKPMLNTEPHNYIIKNIPPKPYGVIRGDETPIIVLIDDKKTETNDTNETNEMAEMLKLVKKSRFTSYSEWFKLLCLMKQNGLPRNDFLVYSKESGYASYNEEDCNRKWFTLEERDGHVGFPTIHKWLDEDGVDWKNLFCKKKSKMMTALLKAWFQYGTLTDKDIADIFYENYNDSLYYTQNGWLHYNQLRGWEMGDENIVVYPISKFMGERMNDFVRNMKKPTDEDEKEFKKKIQTLTRETVRLCSYNSCLKVVKMAQNLFKNDSILKEFDCKEKWFCFSDMKAIDMITGDIVDIKKEDKILTTCGYPLPHRITNHIEEAKKVVLDVVGEKYYESYTSIYAYQFSAGNTEQIVAIHTGSACNGKSFIGNLMRCSMGQYAGILPIEQLTQNSSGRDTANSALAQMRGKRYAQLNEPEDSGDDKNLTLKVARIKELSGESETTVRELHQKATTMRIDFKMNILCNEIPKLSKNDQGIERRIKVITYPFKFVDDVVEDFHKKKDDELFDRSRNDKHLHNGFLWMMMDIFKKNQGKIIITEDIKKESRQYMKDNNPIGEFVDNYEESEEFVLQKNLYKEYSVWCVEMLKEAVSTKKFTEYLRQLKVKVKMDNNHGNKIYLRKNKE